MDNKSAAAEYNRKVGKRLAALRQSRSLNQAEAAKALGITQSGLSQYENGQRTISCAAAIELMRLYGAGFEDVFGPCGSEDPAERFPAASAEDLLLELSKSMGSSEISSAVNAYRLIAAYRMLRALYECNPHNSGSVFETESEEARLFTEDLLIHEPDRLVSFIKAAPRADRERLELPVERSAELRAFIESCEALFIKAVSRQPDGTNAPID